MKEYPGYRAVISAQKLAELFFRLCCRKCVLAGQMAGDDGYHAIRCQCVYFHRIIPVHVNSVVRL